MYTITITGRQPGYSAGTYGYAVTDPDGSRAHGGGHSSREHARADALAVVRRLTGYRRLPAHLWREVAHA